MALGTVLIVPAWLIAYGSTPLNTQGFYAAAAQIVPVFLVALAVEQTITQSLGTESSYVNESIARAKRDYIVDRPNVLVYLRLWILVEDHAKQNEMDPHTAVILVPRGEVEALESVARRPLPEQWRFLVAQSRDELSPNSDEPVDSVSWLGAYAVANSENRNGTLLPDGTHHEIVASDIQAWIDDAFDAYAEYELADDSSIVHDNAVNDYRNRRTQRIVSTIAALSILGVGEALALIGVALEPSGARVLFASTCAALISAITMVIGSAIQSLFYA